MSELALDTLLCLSFSAKDEHSVSLRERARLPEETADAILENWNARLRAQNPQASVLYLKTCHRVEVYSYGVGIEDIRALWQEKMGGPYAHLAQSHTGADALRHLLRVTASLESEVLGETQITGQVRDMAQTARNKGQLHGPLDRCLQQALRSAKRLRRESGLGEGTVSIAHVAVDGLLDVFDSLEDKNVLVVGAGPMAQQSLERLLKHGVKKLSWVNRTRERLDGHELAHHCEIIEWEQLSRHTWEQHVCVLATASPVPLLTLSNVNHARPLRPASGPRVILDLGLPRNVEETLHGHEGFLVRNVDEFTTRVREADSKRRSFLEHADVLVEEEVQLFLRSWENWGRSSIRAQLFEVLEEIEKQARPLHENDMAHSSKVDYIAPKFLPRMINRLIEELDEADDDAARQVLEILVRAWRQPEQWLQRRPPSPKAPPLKKLPQA